MEGFWCQLVCMYRLGAHPNGTFDVLVQALAETISSCTCSGVQLAVRSGRDLGYQSDSKIELLGSKTPATHENNFLMR